MKSFVIDAQDKLTWRQHLEAFERVDVCQLPEYHVAYKTRIRGATPLLWVFQEKDQQFCYPFFFTPVVLQGPQGESEETEFYDVSSVYGYSGPLATTTDSVFLKTAWMQFDQWCLENRVIADFTRYSLYAKSQRFAHPNSQPEDNRSAAVTRLPKKTEELFDSLNSKTRNMIRRAEREGLVSRILNPKESMAQFQSLYVETMQRNQAPDFFMYDQSYFDFLLSLPTGELSLYGVFAGERLISGAIALIHKKGALYHLGASLSEYSKAGAGNLTLFAMGQHLSQNGVEFLNLGGGRTTQESDSLYLFKRNNANAVETFQIGKRIVNTNGYASVVKRWEKLYKTEMKSPHLIFYR